MDSDDLEILEFEHQNTAVKIGLFVQSYSSFLHIESADVLVEWS